MIRVLLFAAIAFAGVGFILSQIFGFMFSIRSTKGQLKRDLRKIKESLNPIVDKLVPLDDEEMKLLSLNQENRTVVRGVENLIKGSFSSIYHEPLAAYAYKEYSRGSGKAVLFVKTAEHDFSYFIDGSQTNLHIDGENYGIIDTKGQLLQDSNVIAVLNAEPSLELSPIYMDDRIIGRVKNPLRADTVNPRAFQLQADLNQEEKKRFLSLSFLYLIQANEA